MAIRFRRLIRELEPQEQAFVESVASSNKVDISDTDDSDSSDRLYRHLFHLQHEIVGLECAIRFALGQSLQVSPMTLPDVRRYEISIATPMQTADIEGHLVRACLYALALDEDEKDHLNSSERLQPHFDGAPVYARLVELARGVLAGKLSQRMYDYLNSDEPDHEVRAAPRLRKDLDLRAESSSSSTRLVFHLAHLEWLANLLWYTMRFDLPVYPTTAELTFLASLTSTQPWRAPLTLGTALESAPADRVRRWFDRFGAEPAGGSGAGRPANLHDAVAHYLLFQHREQRSFFPAIVLSTSQDLEMESALARAEAAPISVVIPVTQHLGAEQRGGPCVGPDLHWIVGTLDRTTDLRRPVWQALPAVRDEQDLVSNPPQWLQHIVVVKLHGSPLHDIHGVGAGLFGAEDYGLPFEHAVVIREREYLGTMLEPRPLPLPLQLVLDQRNRQLCFIGLPVEEWGVRMRLFDEVYRGGQSDNCDRQFIAVNPTFDARSALLDALGIWRWEIELTDFADLLRSGITSSYRDDQGSD